MTKVEFFMLRNFFLFILELIQVVIISFLIILPIRYFLIQPFYVQGASMEPNFYNDEYLIVDEISYTFREPRRGEIIVFRYPKNPQEYFIKRIIGLPGETVQIKDGKVIIYNAEHPQGTTLKEGYLKPGMRTNSTSEEKIELGPNEFFVLGDNRNASKDSRFFGPVNRSFIIGRVFLRGWPFNRIDVFKVPQYQF